MKSLMKSPVSLFALLLAGMLLPASVVRADVPAAKIALCNTGKVLTSLQEYQDLSKAAKQEASDLQTEATKRGSAVQQMKDQLALLVPDSPQYAAKNQEVLNAAVGYDSWSRLSQISLQSKLNAETKALFQKMEKTIGDMAKAKGFNIVLSNNQPNLDQIDLENVTNQNFSTALLQVQVLYSDPTMDITQDVINAMDADYTAKPKPK